MLLLLTLDEKDVLIKDKTNLINFVIKNFSNVKVPYDELYNTACKGFNKALDTYDKDRGVKFPIYAYCFIRNKLSYSIQKKKKA